MKNKFNQQIRAAVDKYGEDHVDIIVEADKVYGVYHSTSNSFGVTDDYTLVGLGGFKELKKYEIEFEGLCVCED